jgi:oligopeptide/dipeptide ABC transporter ATP-binding protein
MAGDVLLEVRDLRKSYAVAASVIHQAEGDPPATSAPIVGVDGVSFSLAPGETLGIVGESGCGKTTLARMLLRLVEPDSGEMRFRGQDWRGARGADLRALRRRIQMVFQDPVASLNARMRVGAIVGEPLAIHEAGLTRADRHARAAQMLEAVGLGAEALERYPHEFSGGQRQRIGIARALAVEPELIICDEPVSALDVSVQAQIINLLRDLQQQRGIAYLFVAHDLAVVEHISHRVMVMYLGKIVETADAKSIIREPQHPYTQALISAVPEVDPDSKRQRIVLPGDVPSPIHPPGGCPFHPRCPIAEDKCKTEVPVFRDVAPGQFAACHFAGRKITATTV